LYTQSYDQSNAKDNTPTGRKGYYSKEGSNKYKSFVSLRYRRVLRTPKPFEHRLGYPRGELPIIKHRQLARQVGAFGDSAVESSVDHDNMIFSVGTAFIFGSWIYEADDNDKL
jgi:hypothetical protein